MFCNPGLKRPPDWYPNASGMSTAAIIIDTVSVPLPTKGRVSRMASSSEDRTTYPSRTIRVKSEIRLFCVIMPLYL